MTMEDFKRGNPIAQNRFRWQTYSKDGIEPYESEWTQLKSNAIKQAEKWLIRSFEKCGKDDMIVKVFNEMNHQQAPTVITLQDAYKNRN